MNKEKERNRPIIEALINTVALSFTATGATIALGRDYYGLILIMFGLGIEWFKYWGRQKSLW